MKLFPFPKRSLTVGCTMIFSLCLPFCVTAIAEDVATNPVPLIRRASQNEMRSSDGNHPYRYKLRKVDDGKISAKLLVETHDGDVARLVEWGDKPIPPDVNQDEVDRLNTLLNHPEIQEHRHKHEQADSDRANKMIKILPDAFLFHYEGMVDTPSGPSYRLSFKPNPGFTPPDREAEVYHGMAGELWIDQKQERMTKLDAHLIDDVNFGWGILGKLYKGGSILVEQKDVGNNRWETTHMQLSLHGKALMLKTITFETTEDATGFQPVPPGGYQDAVRLLLKQ